MLFCDGIAHLSSGQNILVSGNHGNRTSLPDERWHPLAGGIITHKAPLHAIAHRARAPEVGGITHQQGLICGETRGDQHYYLYFWLKQRGLN